MKKLFFLFLAFILALSAYSKDDKEKHVVVQITGHLNLSDLVELVPGSGWLIPASGFYTGMQHILGILIRWKAPTN